MYNSSELLYKVAIVETKILERRWEEMKFLVKPINDKFEGYCFGNFQTKLDCNGQSGCTGQFGKTHDGE